MTTWRIVVALVLVSISFPPEKKSPSLIAAVGVMAVTFLVLWASQHALAWRARAEIRDRRKNPALAFERLRRAFVVHRVARGLLLVAVTFATPWGPAVRDLPGGEHLLGHLLLLFPFLLLELNETFIHRALEAELDRRTLLPGQSPTPAPILQHLLHDHGMWLAVTFTAILSYALVTLLSPGDEEEPLAVLVVVSLLSMTIMLTQPFLLRWIWNLRPMPEGWLKDRLLDWARRERVRLAEIHIWHPPYPIANAGVTGLLPFTRIVFLSTTLLDHLSASQILGVFGHEIGHVRRRHLHFFLLLVPLALVLLYLAGERVTVLLPADWSKQGWGMAITGGVGLPLLFATIFTLSRRFEKEADLAGCRAVADDLGVSPYDADAIRLFSHTMETVCALNGTGLDETSWRHGRVSDRLDFLARLPSHPNSAARFERRTKLLCRALLAGLLVALTLLLVLGGENFLSANKNPPIRVQDPLT